MTTEQKKSKTPPNVYTSKAMRPPMMKHKGDDYHETSLNKENERATTLGNSHAEEIKQQKLDFSGDKKDSVWTSIRHSAATGVYPSPFNEKKHQTSITNVNKKWGNASSSSKF